MEAWERTYIEKHLSELMKATSVRPTLLHELKARKSIGDGDVDDLERGGLSEHERSSRLYKRMMTRTNGFEILSQALLSDSQTGAYRLLQHALVRHNKRRLSLELSSSTLFSSILPAIDALLDDPSVSILIVSTPDLQLSLKRFADVDVDYVAVHDVRRSRLSKETLEKWGNEKALVIPTHKVDELLMTRLEGLGLSVSNVVLLTTQSVEKIEQVIAATQKPKSVLIVREEIFWTDLTQKGQEMVLQQKVMFQGQAVALSELPRELLRAEEIRGQIIFELLNELFPELVKNSVPSSPKYYVPRKISVRVSLAPEVFRNGDANNPNDIFVVEGLELHQLTNLTRKRNGEVAPVARSSSQLKNLSAQFILLEHVDDYQDICELSSKNHHHLPVHLISHRNGEYLWRRSHRSLGVIQNYVREADKHVVDEDLFVESCLRSKSPVCIADSPGMGKTRLLTRMAEKVMREESVPPGKSVVRFLTLRDMTPPELQNGPEENIIIDVDFACELIARSSSEHDFGRQLVIQALKSEDIKCHVFLDGYDELLSAQVDTVNQILGCLRRLPNTQLYVTTRLNRCQQLEEALITTGSYIKPFDEEDQVAFLTGYWNEAGAETNDKLEQFAISCLNTLKDNLTEAERDIAGVPLQCRLLAELYTTEAKRGVVAVDDDGHAHGHHHDAVLERDATCCVSSLFGMFQLFTELSFGKVATRFQDGVRRLHMYHAIKLLFPEIEQKFKVTFLQEEAVLFATTEEDSILLAPGILEKSGLNKNNNKNNHDDDDAQFIHRTLAEYLVAHFVNEFLLDPTKEPPPPVAVERSVLVGEVLRKILWTTAQEDVVLKNLLAIDTVSVQSQVFEYSVICYFLNSLITSSTCNKAVGVATSGLEMIRNVAAFTSMENIPTLEFLNILTAAVASNFPAIASLVTQLRDLSGDETEIEIPWSNLFLLAAKHAGTELLCLLTSLANKKHCQVQKMISTISEPKIIQNYPVAKATNQNHKSDQFVVTPLHVAVHWGNYNVTILLLNNNYGLHDLLFGQEKSFTFFKYLLHAVVMESCEDAEQVIDDKIQIIKCLCPPPEQEDTGLSNNIPVRSHILEERMPDGTTPLLCYHVHPQLVQTLIRAGADVNAVNEHDECVLHTAIRGRRGNQVSPSQYHSLVASLSEEETSFKHYDLESEVFGTPLFLSVPYLEIQLRTVQLFLDKGVDINYSWFGESILFHVVRRGRCRDFVRQFAGLGANLRCEINGRSCVIPGPVMEAVEYVIETSPSVVNSLASCKELGSETNPSQSTIIINAMVELQEMENHELSSYVLSLHHNNESIPTETAAKKPCFVVHSLCSKVINSKWKGEEDEWGLAFNYNKIQKHNLLGDVAGCKAKVVLLTQDLVDQIGKALFEESGKGPIIVAVQEIGLMDLPRRTQQLICEEKFGVQSVPNLPIQRVKGKFLFDLTIKHHLPLINHRKMSTLDESKKNNSGWKISDRRNISTSVFSAPTDDVLVIKGLLDLHELASLIPEGTLTDSSSNQLHSSELLTAKCILLDCEDDFDKLCSLSSKSAPVHLLSYRGDGNFTWIKSHGSLATLQQHIHHHEHQREFSVGTFLEEITTAVGQSGGGGPTCLAYDRYHNTDLGSPVTSVIAALKKEIIYQNPTSVPFCLELDRELIEKIQTGVSPATAPQFIADTLSDYALGREYILNCIKSEEISCHLILTCKLYSSTKLSTVAKTFCEMPQSLENHNNNNNIQLHFIVPTNELPEMEEALQTLGFNFTKVE